MRELVGGEDLETIKQYCKKRVFNDGQERGNKQMQNVTKDGIIIKVIGFGRISKKRLRNTNSSDIKSEKQEKLEIIKMIQIHKGMIHKVLESMEDLAKCNQ